MNQQTLQQMKQLRFYGMYRAFETTLETQSMSYTNDELIAYLMQSEWDDRHNRKIERLTKSAKFRYKAAIEDIIFDDARSIEKNQMQRFYGCDFINNKENILFTGSTGVGKSYIASAIGYQACSKGYKVKYYNINKLFGKLKLAKADGSYLKEIDRIEKQDLIILDDFGLQQLDHHKRQAFMEIIEDRHGKRSTIIASQLPVIQWHQIIAEQTIADAILDRIVHAAHRVELKGDSMRRRKSKKTT
jgi:DNA replication protein DnaC